MKSRIQCAMPLLFLGMFCGCVATGPNLQPISDSSARIDILGVSMLPPQEAGWHYERLTPAKIEFGKALNRETSFVIMVSLSWMPKFNSQEEFMKTISAQRQRESGNPRYETFVNEEIFSDEKDTPAFRFHTKYKDKGSPYLPKGEEAFIVEDYGIFCRHPMAWNVSVNIVCSQRTLPDNRRVDWDKLANEFIRNVEFIEFPEE